MAKLNIAYNNAYRIVMNYRRRNSDSLMFFNDYVNNLTVKLRKSYYSLYKRIQLSCNSIIVQLYEYNIVFPSPLFTMWYQGRLKHTMGSGQKKRMGPIII